LAELSCAGLLHFLEVKKIAMAAVAINGDKARRMEAYNRQFMLNIPCFWPY
jgi:hypothetical protein